MEEVIQEIPGNEDVVIKEDTNVHVRYERRRSERIHGRYGYGEKNETGEKGLDFELPYDLIVINVYFRKRKKP